MLDFYVLALMGLYIKYPNAYKIINVMSRMFFISASFLFKKNNLIKN